MTSIQIKLSFFVLFFSISLLTGCATTEVKSANVTKVIQETAEIPEAELLDVGIQIFDPGLDNLRKVEDDVIYFPEIRIAEASYIPYLLMGTLQTSSAWGAVRVVPADHDSVDVLVKGLILQSDGEILNLEVTVTDSAGNHWFKKEYKHKASRYSYNARAKLHKEPFQNIYNNISNDLLLYKKKLSSQQLIELRNVSELKFAKSFSPDMFSEHLAEKNGRFSIIRLPAKSDPMFNRVKQIRERDYLFVDTLQEYYDSYVKEMKAPYQIWRQESFHEVIAMRNMKRKASNQKLIGAASIIGGILAAGNSNASARAAGAVSVAGGGYVLKDGYDRDAESEIHLEALQELGDSLEASLESHVIELEDRTVTLSGTVDNQYKQWRKILQEIYKVNVGE